MLPLDLVVVGEVAVGSLVVVAVLNLFLRCCVVDALFSYLVVSSSLDLTDLIDSFLLLVNNVFLSYVLDVLKVMSGWIVHLI